MGIIRNKIKKATKKVALMEAMDKLKKDLQKLGQIPDGKGIYDYAVKFFNIITSFQDNNAVEFELFKNKTDEARTLATHVANAGRNQYGIVRAQRGEEVTLHNLYLGNTYGLWTNTAAFWSVQKDRNTQAIIQNQLRYFIKTHREPMIKLIGEILQNNKKPNNVIVKVAYKRQTQEKGR